jgi:hypothetical protein
MNDERVLLNDFFFPKLFFSRIIFLAAKAMKMFLYSDYLAFVRFVRRTHIQRMVQHAYGFPLGYFGSKRVGLPTRCPSECNSSGHTRKGRGWL